jgi:hypothetical protein
MLDSLDTLIGFALIFTVVSLLITILVQAITSLLNLRGKNLAWGVAEAFEAIAPELVAEKKERGKALADHLLKDPLISDSQFGRLVGKATAVRPEELFDLLHRIAIGKKEVAKENKPKESDLWATIKSFFRWCFNLFQKKSEPTDIKQEVIILFKNLGVPADVFVMAEEEKVRLQNLKADIDNQLKGLPKGPAEELLRAEAKKVDHLLTFAATSTQEAAIRWAAQGEAEIQKIYQKFEHWFETGEERAQEWFTTHARIITSLLGIGAALLLQLDMIEIYKLVSSNRQVRDSLVAQTKAVLDQGEKVLKERPAVMQTALKAMTASGNTNLTNVVITVSDTVGTAKAKIREASQNRSSEEEVNRILERFDQEVAVVVKTNLTEYTGEYNSITKSLDQTGFELFPKAGWRWGRPNATGGIDWHLREHLLGMLFSALLLSLGAPFWFNTLKSLASLRSSVAKNICEEDSAEKKSGRVDQPGKAPMTVK